MTWTPAARADARHHLHPYTQLRQLEREGPLVIVRTNHLADIVPAVGRLAPPGVEQE